MAKALNPLKRFQHQGQQFPGGALEEVIGEGIGEAGGFQVDLHDEGAPFFGDGGDVAGRGDLAGGADDQEQVAVPGQFFGFGLGRGGNRFAEKDHVGPDEAAAEAIEGGLGKIQALPGMVAAAVIADEAQGVAVVLHHPFGPRGLMQIVDVLGDDAGQITPWLPAPPGRGEPGWAEPG